MYCFNFFPLKAFKSIYFQYYDDCHFDATTYLVVGGSVMLITNLLAVIAVMTPMEWDDK